MTSTSDPNIDELGPVDYLVVEFPPDGRTSPGRWPTSSCASASPTWFASSTS